MATDTETPRQALYLVALPGAEGNKLFFTNDADLYARIDPELPEVDRDILETHFNSFATFEEAWHYYAGSSAKIAAEKWGFC